MAPKKGSEIILDIDSLVFGGPGIGQIDGWKCFVSDVVPGDQVKAQVRKVKKNYGEAQKLEILKPSPDRIEAKCKHFDTCGGCKWQFLSYERQLQEKEQQVRDAVERLGGLSGDLVQTILPCATPWNYRNKMELSFGPGDDGKAMLGFYPPGYHFEVFNLTECHIGPTWMAEIVERVRDFAHEHDLEAFHSGKNTGLLRTLTFREGKNTGEIMVILTTSAEEFNHVEQFKALFAADPRVTSLYWNVVHQKKGERTRVEEQHLAGKPMLTERLNLPDGSSLEFDILPQAFFQTNTLQAELLYAKVLEYADLTGSETVFDLYCGTGTIGLFCAGSAEKVVGIEINPFSVENAKSNAAKNGIENVEYFLGSVEASLSQLDAKPELVIVDPPRSGLGEKVVADCAAFGAKRIIYVSCNPTTMARDLKQFTELGYKVLLVQALDMFPHTHHIESICVLEVTEAI